MNRGPYRDPTTWSQRALLIRLSRMDDDYRRLGDERKRLVLEGWLAGITIERLAAATHTKRSTVSKQIKRWVERGYDTTDRRPTRSGKKATA